MTTPIPLTAQEVEDALRGTKYEGAMKLWELAPATFTTDKELEATDSVLTDARLNAARAIILQRLVGELVVALEVSKGYVEKLHSSILGATGRADTVVSPDLKKIDAALASARKVMA